jgi:hypothetical protein
MQLNETATIFAALARLDELCTHGMELYEASVYVRKRFITPKSPCFHTEDRY